MTQRLVVTGTDTGVGKTVFAAGLTVALGASYWKPVQAGLEDETDSDLVARLAPRAKVLPEAYRLVTACSPHQAARIDGVTIDPDRLTPPACESPLVIEGAGGALVPLAPGLLYADLFARWNLPVVVVARTALGTINHSLLTLEALRARGVTIAGIALIGPANPASAEAISGFGKVALLGTLPWLDPLDASTLAAAFAASIDLAALG
jgi:dethiobiotin synthetase